MNPVSNTAYYCCGVRMEDASRVPSICNDVYAHHFMDAKGIEIFEPFRSETMPNISNISRCRIIDELVAAQLKDTAETRVVTVGAGFDTRPYRLSGGRWAELDEPQLIEIKNRRLAVSECRNTLQRIAIDFARDAIADRLPAQETDAPVFVVIEGVFMYLDRDSIEHTLQQIQQRYPRHVLVCDLMTKRFFEKFAQRVHAKLAASGGHFSEQRDDPAALFRDRGYRQIDSIPMFQRARELGILWDRLKMPSIVAGLLLNVLMRDMLDYAVYRFDYG